MPKASSRLSTEVCSFLQKEIRKAGGDEVFAVGNINADGIVSQASVASKSFFASLKNGAVAIHAAKDNAKALICNHPSGILRPSSEELAIVMQAKSSGLGFYIVNNSVTEVYIAIEPMLPTKKKPIEPAPKIESKPDAKLEPAPKIEPEAKLEPERKIEPEAKLEPEPKIEPEAKLEPAPKIETKANLEQMDLASKIAAVLDEGKVAVFEAGAGVDKSPDYLVPAALWSMENRQRVVVSATTGEQLQQLIEEYIPKAVGKDIKAALVKGGGEYLCLRRLNEALRHGGFFAEDEESLKAIADWAKTASDGSRGSLPFNPSDDLWSSVCCERESCTKNDCPHHSACPFMAERKAAESASLLVASHQLLFADIKARHSGEGYQATAVLPPYRAIVFDEAHEIESAAKSAFSAFVSPRDILRRLNHFVPDKNWKADGMLDILEEMTTAKAAAKRARASAPSVRSALGECEKRSDFKLSAETASSAAAKSLLSHAKAVYLRLSSFCGDMGAVFAGIKEEDDNIMESKAVLKELKACAAFLKGFLSWEKMRGSVYGIERKSFQRITSGAMTEASYPQFYSKPISIPKTMKAAVFDRFRSVVCVLDAGRVNGSFNGWMQRIGAALVEKERLVTPVHSFIPTQPARVAKAPPVAAATASPAPSSAQVARPSPAQQPASATPTQPSSTATKAPPVAPAPASPAPSSAQVARPSPPQSASAMTARPSSTATKAPPVAAARPSPAPSSAQVAHPLPAQQPASATPAQPSSTTTKAPPVAAARPSPSLYSTPPATPARPSPSLYSTPPATPARTAPLLHSSSAAVARPSSVAAKAQPAAPPRPVPPPQPASAQLPQFGNFPQYVAYLLSQKGPLSRILPNFKERPKQIELASNIAAAFDGGKVGMFEAGTGIGKSLAYLIPAVLWSLKHGKKVIVSTAKINLQQQLIQKDIPLVRQIIGRNFNAVLVKGRANYLCLRRLDVALQEMSLFSDDDAAGESLDKIKAWADTTTDGSLADLPFAITDDIRSSVCSESESCLMKDCPHSSDCFFMAEREKADDALVLVANHHLLFADLKVRRSKELYPKERASQEQPASDAYDSKAVLPPYKLIVFDEAHAMESSATSFFTESTSRAGILRQINHFVPDKKRKIFTRLDALEGSTSNKSAAQRARSAIPDIRSELEKLEDAAIAACKKDSVLRLSRKTAFSPETKNFLAQARTIQKMLSSFCSSIRSALEGVSEKDKDDFVDSSAALQKLENAASLLEGFATWSNAPDSVFWIEAERKSPKFGASKNNEAEKESLLARFKSAPLSIAQTIKDTVFNRSHFHSVVCVSATLRVNASFDFWMQQTGASLVERGRLIAGVYPSPFQYDKNVLLALPKDIPFPNQNEKGFLASIERLIPELIRASSGSSLVLFTAKKHMYQCYDKTCALLERSGIRILCQDKDEKNRDKLLSSFRDDTKSVLFATKAFWEGVDAAGETLRHVIIVKLPFTPPDDPVFAARRERIDASGNSFNELSVPQAVIEFRQGFGRLIRQEKDRGVVTVLDSRIALKDYGKTFLESIPKTQVAQGSSQAVLHQIKSFFC